jgi:hypothetical protein
MGRTVVEPLIFMVCFCFGAAGAAVCTGAAGVAAGTDAGAVTTATGVEGGATAGVFLFAVSVQPATAIAAMSRTARPMVMSNDELRFAFMMFHPQLTRG